MTWSRDIFDPHHLRGQKRDQSPLQKPLLGKTQRLFSKQKRKTTSPVQQIMFESYIREDFLPFMEIHLPYWKENGLWYKSARSDPHQGDSRYKSLETIHSWVCELGMRKENDPIKKHDALVLRVSRNKEALEDWKSHETKKCKQSTGIGRGDVNVMNDNMSTQ